MNFIFISPNFPENYFAFLEGLKKVGFTVLGIGDAPYGSLHPIAKDSLTEYYKVNTLESIDEKKNAIQYFINKYGPISYLESNNEYWLRSDAKLREIFNIEGLRPEDMDKITNKAKMKEFFLKAGAKVARYVIADDKEKCLDFIKKVGYPVFTKPVVGVGAQQTFKVKNEDDLNYFFSHKSDNVDFIMEEFIDGDLVSFDGVADNDSNAVICDQSHFPQPIDLVLNDQLDNYYYTSANIEPSFEKIGKNTIKAFNLKKRFFHIEFFRLKEDKDGLGKKGDYVGLECNMRPPGGSTPDLINFALSTSCYQVYADVMMHNKNLERTDYPKYISIAVTRRDRFNYIRSMEEIRGKYNNYITMQGRTPEALSDALGNDFVYGKFETLDEAIEFANFVLEKK